MKAIDYISTAVDILLAAAIIFGILALASYLMHTAPKQEEPELTIKPPVAVFTPETVEEEPVEEAKTSEPSTREDQAVYMDVLEPGMYRDDIPMPMEHQEALYRSCRAYGVPLNIGRGLIQHESSFDANAVSVTGCYGYCQLSGYFPAGLSPEENINAGIGYLGELIEKYGDISAALTAYNVGHDDGTRDYANVVLGYAREFGVEE